MPTTPPTRGPTVDVMWVLLALGLAFQVTGCITTVTQAPRIERGSTGSIEEGDRTLMLVGILGFGLGGVLSLTAVIGFGVLLGMRAHSGR